MSGIYIPNIKFPPKPWSNMLILVLDGNKGTARFTIAETLEKVEVPFTMLQDHGRLIDGDVAEVINFTANDAKDKDFYDGILYAADWISEQPTIIPESAE